MVPLCVATGPAVSLQNPEGQDRYWASKFELSTNAEQADSLIQAGYRPAMRSTVQLSRAGVDFPKAGGKCGFIWTLCDGRE